MLKKSIQEKAGFNIEDIEPFKQVKKYIIPALFGHGIQDELVNYHHSQDLYDNYTGRKQIILFEGEHETERPLKFLNTVQIFFKEVFSDQQNQPVYSFEQLELQVQKENIQIDQNILCLDCHQKFVEQNSVTLQCLHTFCKGCLINHAYNFTNGKIICHEKEYGYKIKCLIQNCQYTITHKAIEIALSEQKDLYESLEEEMLKRFAESINKKSRCIIF